MFLLRTFYRSHHVCFRRLGLLFLLLSFVSVGGSSPGTSVTSAAHIFPTPITTSGAVPPFPNATTARLDTYLSELANLSGSVLVAHNGMVFSKGYGQADMEKHVSNTPQTMFRIGSISKQFTAMAILILQERGKLHVQDALCTYIPNCPQDWQPITIKHLLTHTSGIPDYTDAPDFLSWWTQPQTPEQIISRFKTLPLDFTPGHQFRYSNSGYLLLGYIIERISGQSFATFLHENIFTPLNMTSSGYDSSIIQSGHAKGYYQNYSSADVFDISWAHAAGALYSTTGDLYTWDLALAAHKLVSPQAITDMFTVHIPCAPAGSPKNCLLSNDKGYGYGWFIAVEPLGKLYYHVGYIDGFYTFNGFYPEKNIQIVVLTNLEKIDVLKTGRELATMV